MKGIINLGGYRIIVDESIHAGKYCFKAQHELERTFYFYTDSEESMRIWLKMLMKTTIARDFGGRKRENWFDRDTDRTVYSARHVFQSNRYGATGRRPSYATQATLGHHVSKATQVSRRQANDARAGRGRRQRL